MSTELLKKLRLLTNASIPNCKAALEYSTVNTPESLGDGDILQGAVYYLRVRNLISKHIEVPDYMNGFVYSYTRPNNEVGVLLELRAEKPFPSFDYQDESYVSLEVFCSQLCQHIIGTPVNPLRVSKNQLLPTGAVYRECRFWLDKTLYEKGLVGSGQPVDEASFPGKYEQAVKISNMRYDKWKEEATLLSQKFLFDPKITVADYVKQLSDKLGFVVEISKFTKYSVST